MGNTEELTGPHAAERNLRNATGLQVLLCRYSPANTHAPILICQYSYNPYDRLEQNACH